MNEGHTTGDGAVTGVRCPIVELRQYTLHPGQRDVLVTLFDREFVETQEAEGMAILGQFRDLDDPNRFVWVRGFEDMTTRAEALTRFYSGPAWKTNSAAANATMVDVSDVLLLRPSTAESGFPPAGGRPAPAVTDPPASLVLATILYRDTPFGDAFADFFARRVRPVLAGTGAEPLAWLQTEYAENTFPALPVRTGEHAFVWFARFPGAAGLDDHRHRLAADDRWREEVGPALSAMLAKPPQVLRLAPTPRSLLR